MRVHETVSWLRIAAAVACIAAAAMGTLPRAARAHEDHAPLPAKGVTIVGDQVLLSDKARTAIGLTTVEIGLADLHHVVKVNARVELPWRQQATITSLVAGKIERVSVRPGESVDAGDELVRVGSMELESLQLDYLQASTEIALARRLLDQRISLDRQGVIAGKSVLDSRAALAQKSAQFQIAQQKLLALGLDADRLDEVISSGQPVRYVAIRSPIRGTVTHADVRIGQIVAPTDHLVHVVDLSTLWIVGEVLEADVGRLRKGQAVATAFAAQPGETFRGTIDHVRLKVDRRTRTQGVVISVDNSAGMLRPGMFGRAEIQVNVAEQATVCPTDAVIESRSGTFVLVQRAKGKYLNRRVELGIRSGKQVEVRSGLFPGNRVVVVGSYLLASLLGNEHKARVKTDASGGPSQERTKAQPASPSTVVARATVELPTDRKTLATSQIEGRIARILVEPSQAVRKGQILAEVDSLQLRNIQLELLQTVTQASWTRQSLQRLEDSGSQGATPKRRLWQLQNELEALRHGVLSLSRKLALLGLSDGQIEQLQQTDLSAPGPHPAILTTAPIRAPADGRIVAFEVTRGQVVRPHDPLFEIHDLSKVWAKGYVFERDATRVRVGQQARVTFSAYPDLQAAGTVVRVAPMFESSERVLPIWIEVDNPDHLLKEGMLARVVLMMDPSPDISKTDGGKHAMARLEPIGNQK